jgi:preprotein translocase SecE subunit
MERIKTFFADARTEFRHVNWPTRAEATRLVVIVVGLSLGLAFFLGVFDYFFTSGVQSLVQKSLGF